MDFKATPQRIKDLLQNKILTIPRNQRRYVWTENNWEDLFNDLEFIIKLNEEKKQKKSYEEGKKHFLGSIVLESNGHIVNTNRYEIIDGQQRTITILLFCAALMTLAKIKKSDNLYEGMVKYIIEVDDDNVSHNRLVSDFHVGLNNIFNAVAGLSREPYDDGEKLIENCVGKRKQDRGIGKCFLFFFNRMKDFTPEQLLSMRDTILNSRYIQIVADNQEESYTIFEILNARGQSLQDHELVKNYIMRYIWPRDTVDDVKRSWEELESEMGRSIGQFFKHYATKKYGKVPKDRVFTTIRDKMPKNGAGELLNDILKNASYYQCLIKPQYEGEDANCTIYEYKIFKRLKNFRAEQVRPILLCLIQAKDNHEMNTDTYKKVLKFVHDFFMTYNVIGKLKSNQLQDAIDKYSPMLDKSCSLENFKLFKDNLMLKLPTYQQFKSSFITLGWSNKSKFLKDSQNKKGVQLVFELLESYLRSEELIIDISSIEHIKSDDNKDNGNIGNLLPLEKKLNEKLGDKDWKEKLDTYAESSFKMANNFARIYRGKDFDIYARAELLAKKVYTEVFGFNKV